MAWKRRSATKNQVTASGLGSVVIGGDVTGRIGTRTWPPIEKPTHQRPWKAWATISKATDTEGQVAVTMDYEPRVWNRRRPVNYPKRIEMVGGIAAPLLAGFSLTTVVQIVIGRDHPWLSDKATAQRGMG
jgi:hypothetical protein